MENHISWIFLLYSDEVEKDLKELKVKLVFTVIISLFFPNKYSREEGP